MGKKNYSMDKLTHLKQLESESIHILREVLAEFENPAMFYSGLHSTISWL